MLLPNGRWAGLVLTGVLMLAIGTGCASTARSPLAEMAADVPVPLPDGFYPLKGHYQPDTEDDSYNGWPRYIVSTKDKMIMAYVPTQTIRMGGGIGPDQVPERAVTVHHFYMDIHEVTNLQFAHYWHKGKSGKGCPLAKLGGSACSVCASGGYTVPTMAHHSYPREDCCYATDAFKAYWTPCVNDDHPARNVNWWEAWGYSQWTCKVLPTEAQWEAAARGSDGRRYPWGNDPQIETSRYVANVATGRENYDGYEYTAPVLSYASGVSPFGIYNLSGNVWEWTADRYDLARYAWPSDEDPAAPLARGVKSFGDRNYPNPGPKDIREARVGPMRNDQRSIRGGSFANPIEQARVDTRDSLLPYVHQNNVGFRTILPLPPESCIVKEEECVPAEQECVPGEEIEIMPGEEIEIVVPKS